MSRTIPVSDETHHVVDLLRATRKDKKFDDTVQALLARPDFTEDELRVIADTAADPSGGLSGNYAAGVSAAKKAEDYLNRRV